MRNVREAIWRVFWQGVLIQAGLSGWFGSRHGSTDLQMTHLASDGEEYCLSKQACTPPLSTFWPQERIEKLADIANVAGVQHVLDTLPKPKVHIDPSTGAASFKQPAPRRTAPLQSMSSDTPKLPTLRVARCGRDGQRRGRLSPARNERTWHEAWRERLWCWWLALPGAVQADVSRCFGALGLYLGSRFERLLNRPTAMVASAAPGCEWVAAEPERLRLPDFPELGSFDFTLPPVPLLLPPLEELRLYGHAPARLSGLSSTTQRHARQPATLSVGTSALLFGFAACALLQWSCRYWRHN